MTFDKKYKPQEKEAEILKFWQKNNINKFDENSNKPIFSIDTPPPTMSGKMHIGHAFSFAQQDFIARFKKMMGYNVFYPFGTDDNGLATEKLVQKAKKVDLRRVERKEAVKIVQEYLSENRNNFIQDWKNVGMSCDFDLSYSTIDNHSQKVSQKSFLELFNKGLIERRKGPVMWDRKFTTAIAQAELEDVERKAFLNYVKAKVVGTENTYMIYATTRPEMCFAVVGMSIESEGKYVKLKVGEEFWITGAETVKEKFKKFDYSIVEELEGKNIIGEKVLIPVVEKEVIISHDEAVKADFGTGIAYFCTYGGQEDIEWAIRHKVEPIELLNIYGKLTHLGDKFEGKLAEVARKEIIVEMEDSNDIIFKEEKTQIVNVGERSGVEVEFIVSNQWYVKYLDRKEYFWEMAEKFNWAPEFMKTRIENWIKGLNWDWGFSRQRHYGIPIPVWYCGKCSKQYLPNENQLPIDPTSDKCPVDKCSCGNSDFIGESDVLDTWFTSASTPKIATTLIKDKEIQDKIYPMSLRPQAHDIINFWLFYTMAKNNLEYGINPFKDVAISGWVLAPDGTKMSKSKGNGINPQDIVSKFSNDSIRFAAAATKLGFDQPFQEKEVKTGFSVSNKIFNANKFASMLLENFKIEYKKFNVNEVNSIDKWILAKLQKTIKSATDAFEKYDYAKAKSEFEGLFMRDIADNYIEIVKKRLWKPEEVGVNETIKAQKTLYNVLFNSMKGLAPIMPYITEEVYQKFYLQFEEEKSIHNTSWPEVNLDYVNDDLIELGNNFISIVGSVRKFKSENQVSMNSALEYLNINCDNNTKLFIEDSIEDLKAVTGAKEINFVNNAEIETGVENLKISIKLVKE